MVFMDTDLRCWGVVQLIIALKKSQENLGKNAYCNQKVRRKINFCFSVGEQDIQN